jgi:hypothetical protein
MRIRERETEREREKEGGRENSREISPPRISPSTIESILYSLRIYNTQ